VVSGQLHAQATLHLGIEAPVSTGDGLGGPENQSECVSEEKNPCLC